jgi:hypothetical protein
LSAKSLGYESGICERVIPTTVWKDGNIWIIFVVLRADSFELIFWLMILKITIYIRAGGDRINLKKGNMRKWRNSCGWCPHSFVECRHDGKQLNKSLI